MPPRPKKTATLPAAPPPDPDEALAGELDDAEADAAIDELSDELAAQFADEEFGGDNDEQGDGEADAAPVAQPAAEAPSEPDAGPANLVVLDAKAAPLEPPAAPTAPAAPLPLPPPDPRGDVLGFVNPDGTPLALADAFDMSGQGPVVTVLRNIEMLFRPPGVRTPLQQLRHTKGSPVARSTAQQMFAAEAAIVAALGGGGNDAA
jgi:hypothetical protein